jgi:hypothetical protein
VTFSSVWSAVRDGATWDTVLVKGMAWVGVVGGGLVIWSSPGPHPVADALLAPLVAVLLYILVYRWTNYRGAIAAASLYLVAVAGWLALLSSVGGSLIARNLGCGGSAQLLVGLGAVMLLEARALPPLLWTIVLLAASNFHPQYAFVVLLLMTLLDPRTVLRRELLNESRGAALRCVALSAVAIYVARATAVGLVRLDGVTLPLAWWISSWLLVGEFFMPRAVRGMLVAILCVVTVADYRSWPAMGLVLVFAYAVSRMDTRGRVQQATASAA